MVTRVIGFVVMLIWSAVLVFLFDQFVASQIWAVGAILFISMPNK